MPGSRSALPEYSSCLSVALRTTHPVGSAAAYFPILFRTSSGLLETTTHRGGAYACAFSLRNAERRFESLSEDPNGIAPATREPAIIGKGKEPTDETSSSGDGSLTDMAEAHEPTLEERSP